MHFPFTTYHLPPTPYPLPFTTYHIVLTNFHLQVPLFTYHLPLTSPRKRLDHLAKVHKLKNQHYVFHSKILICEQDWQDLQEVQDK